MEMGAEVEHRTPIEIYRGIKNFSEGELETLLLLLDSKLTTEILIRREESNTDLKEKGLLSEEELFRD